MSKFLTKELQNVWRNCIGMTLTIQRKTIVPLNLVRSTKHSTRQSEELTNTRTFDQWRMDILPAKGTPSSRRSEEHTSELQSHSDLVCRLLLEKKKKQNKKHSRTQATTDNDAAD